MHKLYAAIEEAHTQKSLHHGGFENLILSLYLACVASIIISFQNHELAISLFFVK